MAGRIGARPSAEPGVALLALATSSTPWPGNTILHAAAEEKPAHARGTQRTAALDARQAALAGASMSLWGHSRPSQPVLPAGGLPLRPESGPQGWASDRRFFNKIKQCRRVATRYDKLAANYLAFVQLASIRLWLRVNESAP
jgi:hypothetical protein